MHVKGFEAWTLPGKWERGSLSLKPYSYNLATWVEGIIVARPTPGTGHTHKKKTEMLIMVANPER